MYFKFPADGSIERYFQRFSRRVRGPQRQAWKFHLIATTCSATRIKKWRKERGGEEKRNEEKNEERGMELSAFGREQLGGKRKGTRLCAGSREGGLESVKKICQRTERGRGKKGGQGKKNPRDGKHYINSEMLAPSTRPISNGSTHYDNCILRIYKTK